MVSWRFRMTILWGELEIQDDDFVVSWRFRMTPGAVNSLAQEILCALSLRSLSPSESDRALGQPRSI
jgi:hypothetical protein